MTSNPPPSTRSTTNDDRLSALEVSNHSLRRQVDGHKEELTAIREEDSKEERVVLASFHLQDDALQWYQWYEKTQPNVQWEEFTQALCVRFGPSDYEDFDEALAKVRQTGTVREYQSLFERLAARVQDWPQRALVGSYIGGLKEEIRSEVKLFRPTTLSSRH
ncbi:uncharacterized protein LOC136068679 [Quercus suber]|uniref:uncharacterized protein LOC136068679 n=1 Tax=Quercus suber TaxID=58331 RepID=UPI0032DE49B1